MNRVVWRCDSRSCTEKSEEGDIGEVERIKMKLEGRLGALRILDCFINSKTKNKKRMVFE